MKYILRLYNGTKEIGFMVFETLYGARYIASDAIILRRADSYTITDVATNKIVSYC
jgi:hypothetical protein